MKINWNALSASGFATGQKGCNIKKTMEIYRTNSLYTYLSGVEEAESTEKLGDDWVLIS